MPNWDLEHRYTDLPEGTRATCRYCTLEILLDQTEGGGPGKDWGAGCDIDGVMVDWQPNGGVGLDYGCEDHPGSTEDGSYGHVPEFETIWEPS